MTGFRSFNNSAGKRVVWDGNSPPPEKRRLSETLINSPYKLQIEIGQLVYFYFNLNV